MRTLIAGGGTGGHLTPALAVAQALRERAGDNDVTLVGRAGGLAEELFDVAGVRRESLEISGLDLSSPWSVAGFAAKLPLAVRRARMLLDACNADVVVGAAGYVSVPVVIAASRASIATVLLEQNAVPGRATRMLASRARAVAVSFPETVARLPSSRCFVTGNPIRAEYVARAGSPLRAKFRRVLIMGGSQGARRINEAVMECIEQLLREHAELQVCHQTGTLDEVRVNAVRDQMADDLQGRYTVAPFFRDLATLIDESDLVVMRAGASSLAEVSAIGRPMVLIPYPHAGAHQRHNAKPYVHAGAAVEIDDAECTGQRLRTEIMSVASHVERWRAMAARSAAMGRPHATDDIVSILEQVVPQR